MNCGCTTTQMGYIFTLSANGTGSNTLWKGATDPYKHRELLQQRIDDGTIDMPGRYYVIIPDQYGVNLVVFTVETVPQPQLRIV